MANLFNCVPSQINYVINTRFTIQRGYTVESKRGGGGYIRIEKVKITDNHHYLEEMNQLFDETISEKRCLCNNPKNFMRKESCRSVRAIYC